MLARVGLFGGQLDRVGLCGGNEREEGSKAVEGPSCRRRLVRFVG